MPSIGKPPGRLHKHLHLQHHKHTGRLLHHRHTSYRGLALLLGIAGAFIIGLNFASRAAVSAIEVDTNGNLIHVYATVPAQVPSDGSTILKPTSGPLSRANQQVRGLCPHAEPHVIVAIYMDDVNVGSTVCNNGNMFSLPILVTLGNHVLIAKTYTITGDTGPDSEPVYIDYILIDQPAINTGSNKLPDVAPTPIVLAMTQPFMVFGPGADAVWTGEISGGIPPYHVHIDWGDGSSDNYSTAGNPDYRHHYKVMHSYDVTVTVRDADGRQVSQHYAAVTPFRHPVPILGTTSDSSLSGRLTLEIYGGYLVLLAAFAVLWKRTHRQFAYARVSARPRPFPVRYNNYYGARKRPNRRLPKR